MGKQLNWCKYTSVQFFLGVFILLIAHMGIVVRASGLTLNGASHFHAFKNQNAGLTNESLTFMTRSWKVVTPLGSNGPLRSVASGVQTKPKLLVVPLFYPSPFKISEGSILYTRHNQDTGVDLELRIYDMRGSEVFRHLYTNKLKNVRLPFNVDLLGHDRMPAGVYFYLVLHNNDVLGKGKFAILP